MYIKRIYQMRIMLLGAPGSGKGTLAQGLSEKMNIPHISTGDIFRNAIRNKTKLGQEVQTILANGLLVPDELTCQIVFERLGEADAQIGFIMDGFPRTIVQAETLSQQFELKYILFLELDEETNIQRLTERQVCPECGQTYHRLFYPTKTPGVCDQCGAVPIQRPDDCIEVVHKRLAEYHRLTAPLVQYYDNQQKLKRLDARQNPADLLDEAQHSLQNT